MRLGACWSHLLLATQVIIHSSLKATRTGRTNAMKNKYLLLSLLVGLSAWADARQVQAASRSGTLDAVAQEVRQPSAARLSNPVILKEIFLRLPSDAFQAAGGLSVAQRQQLFTSAGDEPTAEASPTQIDRYDPRNGFISLNGAQFGWEMCYWNLPDGRKLVAVNEGTESGSLLRAFFYQDGQLTEAPDYRLGGEQVFILADFVDLTQLLPTTRQLAQQQFALGEYHLYYQLPQTGTALTVRLDTQHMLDYAEAHDIPDTALKEVQLKWIDYQWKR